MSPFSPYMSKWQPEPPSTNKRWLIDRRHWKGWDCMEIAGTSTTRRTILRSRMLTFPLHFSFSDWTGGVSNTCCVSGIFKAANTIVQRKSRERFEWRYARIEFAYYKNMARFTSRDKLRRIYNKCDILIASVYIKFFAKKYHIARLTTNRTF